MPADLILEPLLVPSGLTPVATLAAGANNGTTPPTPVLVGGSNAWSGTISFGSGATPAAGIQVAVTFPSGMFPNAPRLVTLMPVNAASAALVLSADALTASGCNIVSENAPAASQPVGTFQVQYLIFF